MIADKPRVLVVDDNDVDREQVRRLLADEYVLLECACAAEALQLLERERFHCALLDYRLPDGDGVALIEPLAERWIPALILTGQGDERTVVRALKAGARDYLIKDGLSAAELSRAIRGSLREGRLLVEQGRLEAERDALSATRERLEALLQCTTDFVSILSPGGQIDYINPAGSELVEWEDGELAGRSVSVLYEPQELRRFLGELVPAALRQRFWSGEVTFRARSGELILTDSVVVAKMDDEGKPLFIGLISRDIRERRKLELQFRQAQKMEAVGRLAGGVAHDFNNVLTAIFSFSEFAAETLEESSPVRQDIEEIQKAASRAAELTEQLLSFSRKRAIEPEVVDPNVKIEASRRLLSRLMGEDIEFSFSPQATGTIRIDPGVLEQVLVNLAVNARDAMPTGGKLVVGTADFETETDVVGPQSDTTPAGEYVLLSVSDTGIGMDEETLGRIFEPFFTTKQVDAGTGLGMATVYGLIKQAGGYISVESELGCGTRFRIYLPRLSEPPCVASHRPEDSLQGGSERILLVEDDPQVRSLAKRSLERAGYRVVAADNGRQGLLLAEPDPVPFDLLVTDVIMPHINGRQLAERVGKHAPAMKVLFLSGYTLEHIVHHGVLDEHVALLVKPFRPGQLTRRVREILDGAGHLASVLATRKRRVLIIDDDAATLEGVRATLEGLFWVETVTSGHAALAAVKRDPPDVILCDVAMPGMDGCQFYGFIAATSPYLAERFYFMTDISSSRLREMQMPKSVPVLRKPLDRRSLLEVLEPARRA